MLCSFKGRDGHNKKKKCELLAIEDCLFCEPHRAKLKKCKEVKAASDVKAKAKAKELQARITELEAQIVGLQQSVQDQQQPVQKTISESKWQVEKVLEQQKALCRASHIGGRGAQARFDVTGGTRYDAIVSIDDLKNPHVDIHALINANDGFIIVKGAFNNSCDPGKVVDDISYTSRGLFQPIINTNLYDDSASQRSQLPAVASSAGTEGASESSRQVVDNAVK